MNTQPELNYDEYKKQKQRQKEYVKEKKYLVYIEYVGDVVFPKDEQLLSQRQFEVVSLEEIPQLITNIQCPFTVKGRVGLFGEMKIFPLTEELEKEYLNHSKEGRIKTWRMIGDIQHKRKQKEVS